MTERIKPGPGQESVWDYPRPPRLEDFSGHIQVICNEITIVDSHSTKRVLETSHPPVYYVPPKDIKMGYLQDNPHTSWCEWKGKAHYYDLVVRGKKITRAAWFYPSPVDRFRDLAGYLAFYAEPMDACFVNGQQVKPQPGNFYGGWITENIVGPFKGMPGTLQW